MHGSPECEIIWVRKMHLENCISGHNITSFPGNEVTMNEQCIRVICLYRVSTIGQVDKDDIPMQKQCCRTFVSGQSNWKIVREVYEKGVSGFKKSARERDAIQEIQREAVQGNFDVLLVYMFDLLGRRDDETPFVVEWFVRNGIQVWSAMEGQQRFDSHVDKLLNYIRYWQASGESIKTSVRVKTRMEQLTESGFFTGGTIPYGYRLEKRGRLNKKNQEVNDLVVDEDAAQIIRLIFYKYVYEGYGAQRLCRYLTEQGIVKPNGKNFPNTSINRIIKNQMYVGIIHNGEVTSPEIPELRIIDQETFDRAQELMKSRATHHNTVPLNMKGQSLLVGNIFCGHCKNRLTLTTSGRKRVTRSGEVVRETRCRYQCHYNLRHPGECDGQSGYGVKKVDGIVEKVIRYQLEKIRLAREELIDQQHAKALELAKARYKLASHQLAEKQRELADLESETIKVIRGESRLNIDLLNSLVERTHDELQRLESLVEETRSKLESKLTSSQEEREEVERLTNWADLYDSCTFEARKMIVSQFVKSVYVYRDYSMEIEFNVSFEDFNSLCSQEEDGETYVEVKA